MATIKMNDVEQAAFNARFGSIETESREVKHGKRYENEKLRRAIASLWARSRTITQPFLFVMLAQTAATFRMTKIMRGFQSLKKLTWNIGTLFRLLANC
jgi:hypothetical protein